MTTWMLTDDSGAQIGPVLHDDVAAQTALDTYPRSRLQLQLDDSDLDELDARGVPFYRVVGGGLS